MTQIYSEDMIVKRVPKAVRERTKENMEQYHMSLYDAFDEAVRHVSPKGAELRNAWFFSDYRKFIPEAYLPKYLNFKLFPLMYSIRNTK